MGDTVQMGDGGKVHWIIQILTGTFGVLVEVRPHPNYLV